MKIYDTPQYNEAKGVWEVNVLDNTGKVVTKIRKKTEEEANEAMKEGNEREKKKVVRDNKKKEEDNVDKLEKQIDESSEEVPGKKDELDIEGDLEEEKKEFKLKFNKEEEECKEKAQQFLTQIAEMYLKADMISENEYLKKKMEIEEQNLASLLFQLKTARRSIYKLQEEIQMGNTAPRMFEVQAGLQRVVLEITQFQHDYLQDMEKSMKELREDVELHAEDENIQEAEEGDNVGVEEIGDGNVEYIHGRNKKAIIKQIDKDLEEESSQIKVPKSKNENLHKEGDDEIAEEMDDKEMLDEEGKDVEKEADGRTGLETFEEDEKERNQRKQNRQRGRHKPG